MIMKDHEYGGGDDEGDDDESDDDGDDDKGIVVTLKGVIFDISFFFCCFYNLLPVPQTVTKISSCDNWMMGESCTMVWSHGAKGLIIC